MVRKLKKRIEVFLEKENIRTLDGKGELVIAIDRLDIQIGQLKKEYCIN